MGVSWRGGNGFWGIGISNLARLDAWAAAEGWALPTSLAVRLLADRPRTRPFGPQTGGADLLPAARTARPFLDAPPRIKPPQFAWSRNTQGRGASGRASKCVCRGKIDSACLRPKGPSSESMRLQTHFEGSGQRPPVHRAPTLSISRAT